MRRLELSGRRFGSLLVRDLAAAHVSPSGRRYIMWRADCECGNSITVRGSSLTSGNTTSCGCRPSAPRCAPRKAVVGLRGAHNRVAAAKGPARKHSCIDCGGAALDWSYDHTDQHALVDQRTGQPYSLDHTHYVPRCRRCHKRFDLLAATVAREAQAKETA